MNYKVHYFPEQGKFKEHMFVIANLNSTSFRIENDFNLLKIVHSLVCIEVNSKHRAQKLEMLLQSIPSSSLKTLQQGDVFFISESEQFDFLKKYKLSYLVLSPNVEKVSSYCDFNCKYRNQLYARNFSGTVRHNVKMGRVFVTSKNFYINL